MNDFKILKFLDIFKGLFNAFKIDYPIMREILKVKLILDARRNSNINMKEQNQGDKNNFLRSLPIYLFMGIILIPFVYMEGNYILSMSILFSIFMFFIMTSIISDFSSVLLDLRDNNIILTKPVDTRTLNAAKVLHIIYYISLISLALIGPSLFIGIFKRGIYFSLIYIFTIVLINLFVIMITALVYLFVLKFFNGEKLKDIITYVQIALSAAIALSGQLVVRIFDFNELINVEFQLKWWSIFIPPLWFSSFFEVILNGNRDLYILIHSGLGIIMPIISILLYIVFMPSFERNLRKLDQGDSKGKDKGKFISKIGDIVCKTKGEKNFFKFTSNMIKSERSFKLRVYPNMGYGIIFPLIFLFTSGFEEPEDTKLYLSIYFIALMITPIIQILGYSENPKGSFIYQMFPHDYNEIYKGSLKAVFFKLITPIFLFMSIFYLYIFKLKVVPHLIVAYLNLYLSVYLIFKIGDKNLPFSKAYGITNRGGFLDFFKSSLILMSLGGLHFLFANLDYGIYIYMILILMGNKIFWNKGFKVKGQDYG